MLSVTLLEMANNIICSLNRNDTGVFISDVVSSFLPLQNEKCGRFMPWPCGVMHFIGCALISMSAVSRISFQRIWRFLILYHDGAVCLPRSYKINSMTLKNPGTNMPCCDRGSV